VTKRVWVTALLVLSVVLSGLSPATFQPPVAHASPPQEGQPGNDDPSPNPQGGDTSVSTGANAAVTQTDRGPAWRINISARSITDGTDPETQAAVREVVTDEGAPERAKRYIDKDGLPRTTYFAYLYDQDPKHVVYCVLREEAERPGQFWAYWYELCLLQPWHPLYPSPSELTQHPDTRPHMLTTNIPVEWLRSPLCHGDDPRLPGIEGCVRGVAAYFQELVYVPQMYNVDDIEVRGDIIQATDPQDVLAQVIRNIELPEIKLRANPQRGMANMEAWWWVDGYDGQPIYHSEEVFLAGVAGQSGDPGGAQSIPPDSLSAYRNAGQRYRIAWEVLAGVGKVETGHGRQGERDASGCILGPPVQRLGGIRAKGPMQFLPSSWERFGADGDGDGDRDVCDIRDAAAGAARHLREAPPGNDPIDYGRALYAYNRDSNYVETVLDYARSYGWDGGGGKSTTATLDTSAPRAPPAATGEPDADSCPPQRPAYPALSDGAKAKPAGSGDVLNGIVNGDGHQTLFQGWGYSSNSFYVPYMGHPHFHTGWDVPMPVGTRLYAPAAGRIKVYKDGMGALTQMLVLSSGHAYIYIHLSGYAVTSGEVKAGQLIGYSGNTGYSSGPHLHLEMRPPGLGTQWGNWVPPEHWTCLGGSAGMSTTLEVVIRPTGTYRWNFGDGTSVETTTLGRRCERTARCSGAKVSHTYRTSSAGRAEGFPVTLTVTFAGTYTLGGGTPEALAPIQVEYAASYEVEEAQSILTGP
jgi:murein DD-endopeptidase MepM/ murein hydrolase activator NlpD